MRRNSLQVWKLPFHWQKVMAAHQTALEEAAGPGGDGMHRLGVPRWPGSASWTGTRDSWQFWQLPAGKWLICLLLPPLCLPVWSCKSFNWGKTQKKESSWCCSSMAAAPCQLLLNTAITRINNWSVRSLWYKQGSKSASILVLGLNWLHFSITLRRLR